MRQRRKRRHFTAAQSAEIWDRWQKGEGLKSIGRVFGKMSSSIFAHISPAGGIRPPPRRRSMLALTLAYPLIMAWLTPVEWGPLATGYLGLLLQGAAGEFEPSPVEEGAPAVGRLDPDHRGHGVREVAGRPGHALNSGSA